MPLYEYTCNDCKKDSELLVSSSTKVVCPSCKSTNMEKKLSTFSAQVKSGPDMPPPCSIPGGGCCPGGSCGLG